MLLLVALLAPSSCTGTTGQRLVCAERLLARGAVEAAEAEGRRALGANPRSGRAKLVLARAAERRGQRADALALLREVERDGPRVYAERAARIRRRLLHKTHHWAAGVALLTHYDRDVAPEIEGSQGATRSMVAAHGGLVLRGGFRGRLLAGFERSAHLTGDAGDRDLTGGWVDARVEHAIIERWDLGARLEGRGAAVGRSASTFHHAGGGVGVFFARRPGVFSPWIEGRGLVFEYGEAQAVDAQLVGDLGVGAATHVQRMRFSLRLGGRAVGPSEDYRELSTDVGWDAVFGRAQLGLRIGTSLRDGVRASVRPRASAFVRFGLGGGLALRVDGAWRDVETLEVPIEVPARVVVGGGIEWRR